MLFNRLKSKVFPNQLEQASRHDLNVYLESKRGGNSDRSAPDSRADETRLSLNAARADLAEAKKNVENLNATLEKTNAACDAFRAENAALRQKLWEIAQAALAATSGEASKTEPQAQNQSN